MLAAALGHAPYTQTMRVHGEGCKAACGAYFSAVRYRKLAEIE